MSGNSIKFDSINRCVYNFYEDINANVLRSFVVDMERIGYRDVADAVVAQCVSSILLKSAGLPFKADEKLIDIVNTIDRAAAGDDTWEDVMVAVTTWRKEGVKR